MIGPVQHEKAAGIDNDRKCKFRFQTGMQCFNVRVGGTDFCSVHGALPDINSAKQQAARFYKAALWQNRIGEFADDPEVKSLRQEIGINRLLLEEQLVACRSPNDLILRSHTIGDLLERLRKLVESCDRIDYRNGIMLDRSKLITFGQNVVNMLSEIVQDPDILQQFARRMAQEIEKTLPGYQDQLPDGQKALDQQK